MAGELVIQQSFPSPRPTTNPYILMLAECLDSLPEVTLRTFTWQSALFGRYHAFHAHWPEILVGGRTPFRAAVRQILFLALLLKLRLTRVPWVRTEHNLELPRGLNRRQTALLRLAQRWTALSIVLNPYTPVRPGRPSALIPHGHYRDWFAPFPQATRRPGRVLFFGQVRHYKGVPRLVEAFRGVPDEADLTLRIAGAPTSDGLASQVEAAPHGDARVSLRLEFLTDADLVDEVTSWIWSSCLTRTCTIRGVCSRRCHSRGPSWFPTPLSTGRSQTRSGPPGSRFTGGI